MAVIVGATLAPRAILATAPDVLCAADFLCVCPLAREKAARLGRCQVFVAGAGAVPLALFFAAMLAKLGRERNGLATGRATLGGVFAGLACRHVPRGRVHPGAEGVVSPLLLPAQPR